MRRLSSIALLVNDYDEAIAWFRDKLGFRLVEDTHLSETKRWVLMSPGEQEGCCLLLAKASTPGQEPFVGNQSGGRVFLFLHTDRFREDYDGFRERGVVFLEEPRNESYGTVAVFLDCLGNKWDLIEPIRCRS